MLPTKFECCSSECQECSQGEYTQELQSVLKQRDEVTYAKWIHKKYQYQKMEMIDSGSDIAIQLQDLLKPLQFIHQRVIISHTTKSVTDLRVAFRGLYDSSF